MKTIVLGLGNPLLTDDGVGLQVARRLAPHLADKTDVVVDEDYWGGLRLMERMVGYDRAIVIDAIRTGAEPGTIHCLSPDSLSTQHSASSHDTNLSTALALGREASFHLPANAMILLVGIEAHDVWTFGQQCSPPVQAAIPRAVETVMAALEVGHA